MGHPERYKFHGTWSCAVRQMTDGDSNKETLKVGLIFPECYEIVQDTPMPKSIPWGGGKVAYMPAQHGGI
jgi:hypothetical protein